MPEPQQQEPPWWQRALGTAGVAFDRVGSIAGDAGGVLDAAARIGDIAVNGAQAGLFGGAGNGDALFGNIAGVGDLMSGAGKLLSWDEQGNWDPNWGGAGDLVSAAAGLADTTGLTNLGPVGAIIGGVAQTGANAYEAYENFSKGDESAGWSSVGDATIGALHAGLGSWCPVAELYISGAEFALDSVGTLSSVIGGEDAGFGAGDVVGGVIDAIIPDEADSWSQRAGSAVSDSVGGGVLGTVLGAGAAGVTNLVEAPVNLLDAAAGGVTNWIGNLVDSDRGERDDYWGAFKSGAADVASSVLSW